MFAWLRKLTVTPTSWAILMMLTVPLLVSCTPDANAKIISPGLGALETFEKENGVVQAVATAVPLTLADFDEEARITGVPDGVAVAMASADVTNGQRLHTSQGCAGCHTLDPTVEGMAGPTWVNLGNRSAARTAATGDVSPGAYLYTSIAAPGDYIVDGYTDGVMIGTYRETLDDQDFADIIAFIMTQTE